MVTFEWWLMTKSEFNRKSLFLSSSDLHTEIVLLKRSTNISYWPLILRCIGSWESSLKIFEAENNFLTFFFSTSSFPTSKAYFLYFFFPMIFQFLLFREPLDKIKEFEEQEFSGKKKDSTAKVKLLPLNESGGSTLLQIVSKIYFYCSTIYNFPKLDLLHAYYGTYSIV